MRTAVNSEPNEVSKQMANTKIKLSHKIANGTSTLSYFPAGVTKPER